MTPSRLASSTAVAPPHETLVAALDAAAQGSPPLTIHGSARFVTPEGVKGGIAREWREVRDNARRWSALLANRGVKKGDRVPVLLGTSHAFVEALLGTMLLGAVPVPLAVPMTFGSVDKYVKNLATIVKDAGARVMIAIPRVAEAVPREPDLAQALAHVLVEADVARITSGPLRLPSIGGTDTAFIQYTSGTTGRPKGAVISHRAVVSNAFAIARGIALTPSDVGVSWLPMFHDMGLIGVLLTCICHPYELHVTSPESFIMRPRKWLELLSKTGGTISAAPNFAYEMCAARAVDLEGVRLDKWRVALNGAEPVHMATVRRFVDRFAAFGMRSDAVMPVYGLAEATLAVAFPALDAKLETLAVDRATLERDGKAIVQDGGSSPSARDAVSVGGPVAGTTIEIVDLDGAVVSEREVGEIRIGSASLMDGYFRNESASAEVLSDGRLRTGDLGFFDRGRLFITGRAKEMIIKGGRNYYPYDVERVAGDVDGVRRDGVAAFGRHNEATGTDDLVVVAESTHADPVRREAIAKAVSGELLAVLGIKADEVRICAVGAVPRTTSGKIQRKACAAAFDAASAPASTSQPERVP